jgi:hypothetical protein
LAGAGGDARFCVQCLLRDLISPPDPAWANARVSECQDRLAAYKRGEMRAVNPFVESGGAHELPAL